MRQIKQIIVHCSATREGRNHTIADIERWHKEQGYREVGYHYVIHLDGTIHTGRKEEEIGAHCLGKNATSIGICYIGGLNAYGEPKDTRTDKQKAALLTLLKKLKQKYPKAKVYGHRDFAKKDCPCFDAKEEYKEL